MTDHPGVTGKKYITTAQLRERWGGVSHMTIERKLKNDSNFPKPHNFLRIRMFDLGEIEQYERVAARERDQLAAQEQRKPLRAAR